MTGSYIIPLPPLLYTPQMIAVMVWPELTFSVYRIVYIPFITAVPIFYYLHTSQ